MLFFLLALTSAQSAAVYDHYDHGVHLAEIEVEAGGGGPVLTIQARSPGSHEWSAPRVVELLPAGFARLTSAFAADWSPGRPRR